MGRRLRRGLVAALLVAVATPAHARDLEVGLLATVPAGRAPALRITVHKRIRTLVVHLEGDDGRHLTFTRRRMPVGRAVSFALAQPVGRVAWTGRLEVRFADGTRGAMPLSFATVVSAPIRLASDATRAEVLAGHATIRADHPVRTVAVKLLGDRGKVLGTTVLPFGGAAPGTPLKLHWTPRGPGPPMAVVVTVTDTDGITGGLTWYPWAVDIPHAQVHFATGKAVIRPAETPKLLAALGALEAALHRYRRVAHGVALWIAGHTDTVGPAAANQVLSERRARAIARWFSAHGVRVPIYYRGLGETALAVPTPDETPEARNRRAEYVVAAEDPMAGRHLAGAWHRLGG